MLGRRQLVADGAMRRCLSCCHYFLAFIIISPRCLEDQHWPTTRCGGQQLQTYLSSMPSNSRLDLMCTPPSITRNSIYGRSPGTATCGCRPIPWHGCWGPLPSHFTLFARNATDCPPRLLRH